MIKRTLTLHQYPGGFRTVIKNRHARVIYLSLSNEGERYIVTACRYLDRKSIGNSLPRPKKLCENHIKKENLLNVIAEKLDRKYFGTEICDGSSKLTEDEFISRELSKLKPDYKFLIFTGEGKAVNGIPLRICTCFKNQLHRSIYVEIAFDGSAGIIKNCYYTDRAYREKAFVTPETLTTVRFEYNRQALLNIINSELLADFTHIIFVTDGTIDISAKQPICGYIIH